ncbi:S8 family peptidase [Streptomyces sp. 6N223]|uniref:S8 family peptidase n=1 Tax=Streptomyces sp. 6N223 TaxID=3457412 RepID=UPI003FD42F42
MSDHTKPSRAGRRSLAAALALLAAAATVVLPGAATPAAAQEGCRTLPPEGVPLPEGNKPHPLIERLGLYNAWDLSMGEGVRVAVVDSGVDSRHPDFGGRVEQGSEFDQVTYYDDPDGYVENNPERQTDCKGHGTAVAGLIAAKRDDDRMVGVAPEATIYPVRIVDDISETSDFLLARAIEDAVEAEVDVINISITTPIDREWIRDAINDALAADIVVVASTGNEGNNNVSGGKMYPAAYDGVLGVGAIDYLDEPMDESNAGPWVDLVAYGEDVPVLAAGGEGYGALPGTSFATAQVSGAAALVRAQFPDMSAEDVVQRLKDSASPLRGGDNDATGAGLVDPYGALNYLLPGTGGRDGDEGGGAASESRIPLRPLPEDQPLLSSNESTGLAVSGGLLLAVVLGLLAAPGVRRAARRGWRPGTAPGQSPSPVPPPRPANATGPPAASLGWLGGGGATSQQTVNSTRNRTR